ncbi:MAG: hypothetical protein INR73_03425 [Williamsia sp.]|nr:hypothetical protein [Williamsia sp.]
MQHAINKQVFDFTCSSEAVAKNIRHELMHHTAVLINRLINEVLTKQAETSGNLVIDKIEIDLGDIAEPDFGEPEMLDKFRTLLQEKIVHVYQQNNRVRADPSQGSRFVNKDWEILQSILLHGDTPWWVDKAHFSSPDQLVLETISRYPAMVRSFLEAHRENPDVLSRIATKFKPSTKQLLYTLGSIPPDAFTASLLREFQASGNGTALLHLLAASEGTSLPAMLVRNGLSDKKKRLLMRRLLTRSDAGNRLKSLVELGILTDGEASMIEHFLQEGGRINRPAGKKLAAWLDQFSLPQIQFLYRYVASSGVAGEDQKGDFRFVQDELSRPTDTADTSTNNQQPASGPVSTYVNRIDQSNTHPDKSSSEFLDSIQLAREELLAANQAPSLLPFSQSASDLMEERAGNVPKEDRSFSQQNFAETDSRKVHDGSKTNEGSLAPAGDQIDGIISPILSPNSSQLYNHPAGGDAGDAQQDRQPAALPSSGNEIVYLTNDNARTINLSPTIHFSDKIYRAEVKPAAFGVEAKAGMASLFPAQGYAEDHASKQPITNGDIESAILPAGAARAEETKRSKQIAYLMKGMNSEHPALIRFLQGLPPGELKQLRKNFADHAREGNLHRKRVNTLLEHPYLLKYNLLRFFATLSIPAAAEQASWYETNKKGLPLNEEKKLRIIFEKISAAQLVFTASLQRLSHKEIIILQDVFAKREISSKSEKALVKKILLHAPADAVRLMLFTAGLPEDQLDQLESAPEPLFTAFETRPETSGTEPDSRNNQKKIYIANAGLCLVAPYLTGFFGQLGYIENRTFKNKVLLTRAIYVLQYIATGKPGAPEWVLQLNKLLCGQDPQQRTGLNIRLTKREKREAGSLIESVIDNWKALKNTSVQGFRTSFLQRKGILFQDEGKWTIQVERLGHDMLLGTIPWGYTMIKLPWMKKMLHVEW